MQLTRRERLAVFCAAAVIGILAVDQLAAEPALRRIETLQRVSTEKQLALGKLRARSAEYLELQEKLSEIRERIATRPGGGGMLSTLEQAGKDCGLTASIVYIKPSTAAINDTYTEAGVELKLEAVSLKQVTQFLRRVEASGWFLGVKALHIRESAREPALLDAVILISSVTLAEAPASEHEALANGRPGH